MRSKLACTILWSNANAVDVNMYKLFTLSVLSSITFRHRLMADRIFYDMLVMHDKNLGTQGDCMRASLATLLQEDPATIPHFMSDPAEPNWIYGVNKFLAVRGLFYAQMPNVRLFWHSSAGDVWHLLIGKSVRGSNHAVVAKNGKMVHDPHPSRAGLISSDLTWHTDLQVGFLIRRGLV